MIEFITCFGFRSIRFNVASLQTARCRHLLMILGLCPKPRRSTLAILEADPHALRYRLLATAFWAKICP